MTLRPADPPAPSGRGTVRTGDLAAGALALSVSTGLGVGRRAVGVVRPFARVVGRPPLLARQHQPATWLEDVARRGEQARRVALEQVVLLLDAVVPEVLEQVLRRIDLTELVARHVELDRVVAGVDLDAAAARLDLDALARRLDVDAVVARADLDAVVARVDVDAVVARADLDAVVARVDVDAVVARADLDAVVARVDVDAVARRLDLDAVIDRVDVVSRAELVVSALDLPELIRMSTGSVASETVRGARLQGIAGDEAVVRAVDRLLRRGRRPSRRAGPVEDQPGSAAAEWSAETPEIPPQRGPGALSGQP